MNFSNNLSKINSKENLLDNFNPYYLSNSKNRNYNPLSIYLSSSSNYIKPQNDINSNYSKKNLNLDISSSINNSPNNQKKEINSFLKHYSSFSNNNSINSISQNMNKFNENNKKTLILDLDETLVHSAFTPFSRNSDLILNINVEGEDRTLYVLKRPHVDKFLNELSSEYEIIIFTASISQYANPLLNELDKNNYIKYRLFREHCIFNNGIYIKDLKIFDRKINNMIIIDNNPLSYKNNVENGIPILSWYDNINDNELLKLIPLLKYMSNPKIQDVRTIINEVVDRSKNELNYLAINRIIGQSSNSNADISYDLSNINISSIKDKYRKYIKSEEPKSKLSNKMGFYKNEYNYSYGSRYNDKPLKNNYTKKYNDENKNNNLLNLNYNLNNNNEYNIQNKENIPNNINIDKMDPTGTRISIFSPEEYNISYTNSLNYSLNDKSKSEMNEIENNELNKNMKTKKENNDYILDDYSKRYNYSNLVNKKGLENRPLTPNFNNKKFNLKKIVKKLSLVELTKKALHLDDNDYSNYNKKKKEYETINNNKINKTLNKYNSFFNKESEIIYKEFINNKYINDYRNNKDLTKNYLNDKYFKSYIEESKNSNDTNNTTKNKRLIFSKKINSFNERFGKTDKLFYNKNQISNNDNNNKLLARMKNEKINNFLNLNKGTNKLYQIGSSSSTFYNNFSSENNKNYSSSNKDNYLNFLKKSLQQTKNNLNSKENINTKEEEKLNYDKLDNKKLYNNRYSSNDINNDNNSNILTKYKSISYINDKTLSLDKPINLNLTNNKQNKYHQLTRSSSYINFETDKLMNKLFGNNNYNKENINNNNNNINYNIKYDNENLNYNQFIKDKNKPKFSVNDNNNYYNSFNRTNYLKY